MRSIAIITARGGSKRIPQKNIREFLGKPIMAYSIEAAKASGLFDEVMVSTDSEEIAQIGKRYGASVPFMRSERTSGDYATTADVLLEVLAEYARLGQEFDYMACIYPTAPFVTAEKLRKGMDSLKSGNKSALIPVVRFSYPPQRGYIMEQEEIKMQYPENRDARSQDLTPVYHDAGQFYCYKVQEYLERNGKITEHIMPMVVSELEVQDIDNEEDWKIAELKYRLMVNG